MQLIQLLLPLYDNEGAPIAGSRFAEVRDELSERFGGLTAYTRAPAQGLWSDDGGATRRDDIVVYEVMSDSLDRDWWKRYRDTLERRFGQEEIIVRAHGVEKL